MAIIKLIKQELPNLLVLQRDYSLSISVLFNMMKPLQELFYALRGIGMALVIRQVRFFYSFSFLLRVY